METDLIIIGAGPGGYETALAAASKGLSVTLINGNKLGGTCLNEGCIPTKCMVRDARVINELRHAGEFCADNVKYDIDFNKVVTRKENVVSTLRSGIETLLNKLKVNVVCGQGKFKDAHTVEVEDKEYSAKHIIIATGSVSKSLPIPGADQPWVLDSSSILSIEYVPEHLVIVGGGVIGMEFAYVFNSLGSKVTVIEYMKQILPPFDSDIAKRLKQVLGKQGIEIITGAAVKSMTQGEDYKITVSYDQKGGEQSVVCTDVLMAVGRGPNVDNLNLENAGVEYSRRGIPVDENMRTNVANIYAVGDVNARMMLAHVASAQGKVALAHILGEKCDINLDVVPSAVFTYPECGMVGKTEEQCKEAGIDYEIGKSFYRANGKALAMGESDGICKLIFEKSVDGNGRLIGAHIMGEEASMLAQQCADMITYCRTRNQIRNTIFGHPTLSEIILAAAE